MAYNPSRLKEFANFRRLRFVPRWVVVPTITKQNVAEHTYHVLWIYMALCDMYGRTPSICDIKEVLAHDAEEAVTGDIPATRKKPKTCDGMSEHKLLMKLADGLEAWLFAFEEGCLGNCTMTPVMDNIARNHNTFLKALPGGLTSNEEELTIKSFEDLCWEFARNTSPSRHPALEGLANDGA